MWGKIGRMPNEDPTVGGDANIAKEMLAGLGMYAKIPWRWSVGGCKISDDVLITFHRERLDRHLGPIGGKVGERTGVESRRDHEVEWNGDCQACMPHTK